MKILISWSGTRSQAVAQALRQWITFVIPNVEPWMSAEDIEAGTRWNKEIADELAQTNFGIICLTRENQLAPWILFEAGALAKTVESTFVCPYLIDLSMSELEKSPLAQFQAKQANMEHTWELIRTINRALGTAGTPETRLRIIFDRFWLDLEQELKKLPEEGLVLSVKHPLEGILEETLSTVHEIKQELESRNSLPDTLLRPF